MSLDPLSGAQHTLRAGHYVAHIAGVGASLRSLTYRGRDLVVPFGADELRPAMRGAILAPWPNRTADGRYRIAGQDHQLAVNEIDTNCAAHGLAAWLRFDAIRQSLNAVTLRGWIEPQPGYPWRVRLDATYSIGTDGLLLEVEATNESATHAPFGIGIHPYLLAGDAKRRAVDRWTLQTSAAEVLLTDARLLPTELVPVDEHRGGVYDFREGRMIEETILNHAFTGLARDRNGVARACLTAPDGTGTEITWDESCDWVQIYTADESLGADRRHAVAVEPQSCPPDALNSGRDLLTIAPDESMRFAWRVRGLG
ncbi:aldose 1-epimerase family protein [Agromyces sp. SYSU T00266]|uniref:aldose 1-epimerase family protein n=1 Tax=Agromyces zhanjiangensis TaxID=3158562 RepID=UPI003396EC4A